MFQIHGLTGRIARARADELRLVQRVLPSAPSQAVIPVEPWQTPPPSAQVHWQETAGTPDHGGEPRPPALQAYAQVQQTGLPSTATRKTHALAAQWMSVPVITVQQDQPAVEALAVLRSQGIGQAPVLDVAGQLVGMLLRKDVQELLPELPRLVVRTCMRTPVPSADPGLDLHQVARALLATGLPGLPLVDTQGALAGFIARGDLLRAAAAEPSLDLWG